MEYFPHPAPAGVATCEDAGCGCSNGPIDVGTGYLFVSNQVVKQRRDQPTTNDGPQPLLLCRDAARRRDIDLEISAEDAAHWWETGSVGLRATPRRELKFREFAGPSLEEAERLARESIAGEFVGTDVVHEVRKSSATAQGSTEQEALATVKPRIPGDAYDLGEPKVIQEAQTGEVEVTESSEPDARRTWRKHAPRGANLIALECRQAPRNGFAGMGKRSGTWTARWSAPVIVEVTYTLPAVVSARYFP